MWVAHGWVFMVYVVVAFLLSRAGGWTLGFTIADAGRRPDPAADLLGRAPGQPAGPGRAPRARPDECAPMTTAFVLGGGGVLGAVEVGMLRALFERDIAPDLVLGTSVGALNGAMVARDPTLAVIDRLTELWQAAAREPATCTATARCARSAGRCRPAPTSTRPKPLTAARCATSSATSPSRSCRSGSRCARPASSGPPSTGSTPGRSSTRSSRAPPYPGCCRRRRSATSTSSTAASSNSIPLGRAVQLGADPGLRAPGRPDRPAAQPPRRPWEVARVSFEIARRHRFAREMGELPDDVEAHVLPGARHVEPRRLAPRRTATSPGCSSRIDATYEASVGLPRRAPGRPMIWAAAAAGRRARCHPGRHRAVWVTPAALADRRRRALAGPARPAGGRCGCCGW